MGTEQVVALFRNTLQAALLLGAPILLAAILVSLLINVAQVLTSLQDQPPISTVPRLAAVAAAALLVFSVDVAQVNVVHHRHVERLPSFVR